MALHKSLQKINARSTKNSVAKPREDLPSSPTLLPKEKGARILVPSPFG
jgi:hypothetical protein